MGRSVETVSNATHVGYFDVLSMGQIWDADTDEPTDEWDEWTQRADWDDFIGTIHDAVTARYPSMYEEDEWYEYPYQETTVIVRNAHADVTVSEWGGIAAVSVVPRDDNYDNSRHSLARHWCEQNGGRLIEAVASAVGYDMYNRVGAFSNGEAVYTKVEVGA